jgi:hypothetical protein
MRHITGTRLLGLTLVAILVATLTAAPQPCASASSPRNSASCTNVGTYRVGVPLLPRYQPNGQSTGSTSMLYPIPYPFVGSLSGSLAITSYTTCGVPTAGSFSVRLAKPRMVGIQPLGPRGSTGQPGPSVVAVPIISDTTVLSATGSFAQDPAHAGDPLYLLVSATVTYGHFQAGCRLCPYQNSRAPIACAAELPCTIVGKIIVTRKVTFSYVTGYLTFAAPPSTVALSFLPPPEASAATSVYAAASQPITLVGVRR